MANTTFTGPVTALNGFIGGANVNAGVTGTSADTQQGSNVAWTVGANISTLTIATGPRAGEALNAVTSEGVLVYVADGATGNSVYAFSNGTDWLRADTRTAIAAS
tara:strand:- start:2493 stop:2807 length:315 start_codon:yes stop_codon:yes gene_type:complete